MRAALIAAALAALAGATACTTTPKPAETYNVIEQNASVPFAGSRVNGFQVLDDRSLVFRIGVNRWYRAEVWQPCKSDLKWTNTIGFDPSPTNTLDRFAYVLVRGNRCPLSSLDEISRPMRADGTAVEERALAEASVQLAATAAN
jgi:hypothetical protein